MADCKPDRSLKRHGGEVWTCQCGTVAVTLNGVTVRYSPRDFRRLVRLVTQAEAELFGARPPTPAEGGAKSGPPPNGGGGIVH